MRDQQLILPKTDTKRLKEAALRYGFAPKELMHRIIAEATQQFLTILEESLDEYKNSEEIENALKKALHAERKGKILNSLPSRINRSTR